MSVIIEHSVNIHPSESESGEHVFSRTMKALSLYIQRHRQRKQLAQLDDRLLSDIGISRSQAHREYSRPFWK